MANHKATGKKTKKGPELAQRCRTAILNAFDAVERDGKLISEVLAQEFQANPIKFMELASKYIPKQIEAEVEKTIIKTVINAQPEMTVDEWQKSSGNHSQDHKPH